MSDTLAPSTIEQRRLIAKEAGIDPEMISLGESLLGFGESPNVRTIDIEDSPFRTEFSEVYSFEASRIFGQDVQANVDPNSIREYEIQSAFGDHVYVITYAEMTTSVGEDPTQSSTTGILNAAIKVPAEHIKEENVSILETGAVINPATIDREMQAEISATMSELMYLETTCGILTDPNIPLKIVSSSNINPPEFNDPEGFSMLNKALERTNMEIIHCFRDAYFGASTMQRYTQEKLSAYSVPVVWTGKVGHQIADFTGGYSIEHFSSGKNRIFPVSPRVEIRSQGDPIIESQDHMQARAAGMFAGVELHRKLIQQ